MGRAISSSRDGGCHLYREKKEAISCRDYVYKVALLQ